MAEETQTENDALIADMVNRAKEAKEPGTFKVSEVLHRGDGDIPSPMTATQLESAGYVYIYDTETGEVSVTNRNMLMTQLKKKRPDGSRVFTTINPNITPKRGTLKCMLHPDDPNYFHYQELGLPECRKANLVSPYQVKRHMQKRHPAEWATIEEERAEKEKERDRALRERLLKSATGKRKK